MVATKFQQDIAEINEALLIAGLRQHEMTAEAEHLNEQLRIEIAERKRAENILRQSEKRYRNLFDSIDEGFCILEVIFDEKGKPIDYRFLEVNPGFEKQSGLHGATGKRMREFVPNIEEFWFKTFGKVALTGEPVRFVNEAKELDGRWFDVYVFRIGETDSRKVAVLFKDITERRNNDEALKQAKEQIDRHATYLEGLVQERTAVLKEANDQLATFVYSIAHDLRAPLRSMQGFSQVLLDDFAPSLDENAANFLKRINASAEFLDKMILDLLAFSVASGVKNESELQSVSVEAAWDVALYQYADFIEKTKAQIETIRPLPSVHAHGPTLAQVLAHLLSNALKFVPTGESPKIRFWAEDFGQHVRLWVEDSGIGISPEHHQRVYRAFERLDGERYPGTGIGLAIVRKSIDRMGGWLGLESAPGKGSKFYVELRKA